MDAVRPAADPVRVVALGDDDVLGRGTARSFDRITRLAERLLDVPVAMVTLDDDHGIPGVGSTLPPQLADRRRTSTTGRLVDLTMTSGTELVVSGHDDLLVLDVDGLVHATPVRSAPSDGLEVAAYAGQPLVGSDGEVLGALCVVADEPRVWTDGDRQVLADLAALAVTEVELATRAARIGEVTARLTAIAEPLARTEDAVTSLSNVADRAGDPRVERLASLARTRLAELQASTNDVQRDLGHLAEATATSDAVNLGVRLLRAHQLVTRARQDAAVEVAVLHRPLTIAGDAMAYERRLVRLLAAAAELADATPLRVEADRVGSEAVVRLRWDDAVPVTELVRLASLAQAVRHGDADRNASLATAAGRTIAALPDAAATSGPDGTVVEARIALRSEPDGGAAGPRPTPGAFPWSQ